LSCGVKRRDAPAARRRALCIGNRAYPKGPLFNSINDSAAMAAKLRSMGYDVTEKENLSIAEMQIAICFFINLLGENDTAVFFFAGHGFEYDNQNWLIATDEFVDGQNLDEEEIPQMSYSVHDLQTRMERTCMFPVIILDCCRKFTLSGPLTRNASFGLQQITAQGSYIALACAPNKLAEDGRDGHGTFTAALLNHVDTNGEDIDEVFRRVRSDVVAATKGRQWPWTNHALRGKLYLAPPLDMV